MCIELNGSFFRSCSRRSCNDCLDMKKVETRGRGGGLGVRTTVTVRVVWVLAEVWLLGSAALLQGTIWL